MLSTMAKREPLPDTFEPGPEDILTTPEAELLQAADRREQLCPRCAQPLTADMMVGEVYQGVMLSCFEGCGFREL
jgi:hypothetical protein